MTISKLIAALFAIVAITVSATPAFAGTTGPGDATLQCAGRTGDPETCMAPLLPETGGNPTQHVYDRTNDATHPAMDIENLSDEQVASVVPMGVIFVIVAAFGIVLVVRILNRRSN